jgi:hypothetical protein
MITAARAAPERTLATASASELTFIGSIVCSS